MPPLSYTHERRTNDMGVVIRSFLDHDFDEVVALEHRQKGNQYGAAVFVRQSAALYSHTFLVAENDTAVVGYTVGAEVQDDPATAWVLRLNVSRQRQGEGIGTALLSRLISELATRQVRQVFLSVAPDNIPAKKIYAKLGFVNVAHQPAYFCKGEDRDIMRYLVDR
jgi:[ribosomal protein S18]-alanine N-acetyltransferase